MDTKWPDKAVVTVAALLGALTGIVLVMVLLLAEGAS